MIGNYKNGKREGEFIGYYQSGKPSGKAKFSNGKQVSAESYNEDGSVNSQITEFIRESEYPGGSQEWLAFISNNVRYPRSAVRNKVEGVAIVQFIVNEKGDVIDVTIIKSVDPDVDAEAMRVVKKSSGKWIPAVYAGRLVKSYKKQPFVFKIP
jgi:TonB family protein